MLLAVLLLAPAPCLCQRWMLLGGYTGFEGESDAGATAQVLVHDMVLVLVVFVVLVQYNVVALIVLIYQGFNDP